MSVNILLAPAVAGKTAYVLDLAREAAQDLNATPRVVVPTHLQVRAFRRRLAESGGAIGVRVSTFDRLYAEVLGVAGEAYTELSDAVQHRLIRAIVDELPLAHYASIRGRPGFIHIVADLIRELKAARIWPETFSDAVASLGDEPRLTELGRVYGAYQEHLQTRSWADRPGLGWLAVEALEERAPDIGADWPLLIVDGFDSFTPVQLALLQVLAKRVGKLIVTLTGAVDHPERKLVHNRFAKTRRVVEESLGVPATPLPALRTRHAPPLTHLEANLFRSDAGQIEGAGAIDLIEAPSRAAEVRAALRWLKVQLVNEDMRPGDVALLARNVAPYRPFIRQTAAEFRLPPIHLVDGLPLRSNPAIAALLDLLRLMLPRAQDDPEPALPWRSVIEAWRSPYFDWSALPEEGTSEPIGITVEGAYGLDIAARWGRVVGGLSQWEEVLTDLASMRDEPDGDEERDAPAQLPRENVARALRATFHRFIRRLTPPDGDQSCREFVGWLETLIGSDPAHQPAHFPSPEEPTALNVVSQARAAPRAIAERDVAALQALKDILRGLVWAEEALGTPAVTFPRFIEELAGAVEAASYRLPRCPGRDEILVADVVQARGVPFRAVAILGLAEGEFPATLQEDPFLRDADRKRLREDSDLSLEPSTESAEVEYFYEAIARPRDRLLLTRPRLAENGALWQASPLWEEVRRLVDVDPTSLMSESVPAASLAASWPELMGSLAKSSDDGAVSDWVRAEDPARLHGLHAAARLLSLRERGDAGSPCDGSLSHLAEEFSRRLGARHTWSTSRLESYRTCPYLFFVGTILGLEPRDEPAEGLDARQLGNIYHRMLEKIYAAVTDPSDLAQLVAALPDVAQEVLDEAPHREGFRATRWWQQTRHEIEENVRRSLEALAENQGDFIPTAHEAVFGMWGEPSLVIREGEDTLRVRGLIDRVDRDPGGRLRIIDYKTAGPSRYGKSAVRDGKKLQVPLYALAARDALGLGEPVDGFYWHVVRAEPSGFTMGRFDGGPAAAMAVAVGHAWEAVHAARSGHFVPRAPDDGCPSWCGAAAFCWHHRQGYGG